MLALASVLAMALPICAQPIATDSAGHVATKDTGGFEDVRAVGTVLPLTDGSEQSAAIGFSFPYRGSTHTSVFVSSEGVLTFNSGAVGGPTALPNATAPNNVIAPFWADLDLGANPAATVHTATIGSAPARRFIVQWSDVALAADAAARLTFQVALHEATGRIEFRYGTMRNGDGSEGSGAASGAAASIGTEDGAGAVGIQAAFATDGFIDSGDRVVIEPGPAPTPALTLRSATAPAGTEVEVQIDLTGPIDGTTLIDAELAITGSPAPAIRSITVEGAGAATLPNGESLPISAGSLRFQVPLDGSAVLAPKVVARIKLVVPPGATAGSIYGLALNNVALTGASVAPAVIGANLTVGTSNPGVSVDSVALTVIDRIDQGQTASVTIETLGSGKLVPNAPFSLWVGTPGLLGGVITSGTTGADGRVTFSVDALTPGRTLLVAGSYGLTTDARTVVEVVQPVPPGDAITSSPAVSGTVASLYEYQLAFTNPSMAFVLENAPAGMTIDAAGRITWVPLPTQIGTHEVVVRTVDGSPSQSFTVVVEPGNPQAAVNQVPQHDASTPASSAEVGQAYSHTFTATDGDGDTLTFTVQPALPGMVMTPTGQLSWIPQADQVGSQDILVLVSDGKGGMDARVVTVSVTPTAGNADPVITSTAPTSAPLGSLFTYDVDATDADALTYSLDQAPAGMTIDSASGLISWTPWADLAALQATPITAPTVDVTVRVLDAAGNAVTQAFTLTLTGTPSPMALPAAVDFGEVQVGQSATAYVRIDNGGQLPLQITSITGAAAPYEADLRVVGGEVVARIVYSPTAAGGPHNATLTVTSSNGTPATATITATGTAVSTARPRITSLPSFRALTGRTWIYPIKTTIANPTYSLSGPAGMTFNAATGVVRWTPSGAQAGNHTVAVTVSDGTNSATQTFSLVAVQMTMSVTSTPVRTAPGINEHLVTIALDVNPSRTVFGANSVGRVVVDHVLPGDGTAPLELVSGSTSPAVRSARTTSEGHVLSWLVPLATTRIVHTVKAHDQVAGTPRPLSVQTRARLLSAPDVIGLGEPYSLLRSYPSLVVGSTGLGYSPDDDVVITQGSNANHLRPTDGVSQGTTAIGGGYLNVSGGDVSGRFFGLATGLMNEFAVGGASQRSTSTARLLLGSTPLAMSVDPLTRNRWFVHANQRLQRIDRYFGVHQLASDRNPFGLAFDPPTGNVWVAPFGSFNIRLVDPAGGIVSQFSVGQQSQGLHRDADGKLIVVAADNRVYRYAAGTLEDSTNASYYGVLTGVSRDPATGELILSSNSPSQISRLGAQFGTKALIDGATAPVAVTRDPGTGAIYILNSNGRVYHFAADMTPTGNWLMNAGFTTLTAMSFNATTGNLEILDPQLGRIFAYTTTGTEVFQLRVNAHVSFGTGMVRSPAGELALVDSLPGTADVVRRLGPEFGVFKKIPAGAASGADQDPVSGRIYISDLAGNVVRTLDSNGNQIGVPFSTTVQPTSVAWHSGRGTLLIPTELDRLEERTTDGTLIRSTRLDQFVENTTGISIRSNGQLYLSDQRVASGRVWALGPQFGIHTPTVLAGNGAPNILGLADDGTYLWGVDTTQNRIYRLNRDGTETAPPLTIPLQTILNPSALTYDSSTGLLVVAGDNRIEEYSTAGGSAVRILDLSGQVGSLSGVVSKDGALSLLEPVAQQVTQLSSSFGKANGSITTPRGISRAANGELWTVSNPDLVERRAADGTPLSSWSAAGVTGATGIVHAGGTVRIIDRSSLRLFRFADTGGPALAQTRIDRHVSDPQGIAFAPNGDLLIADATDGLGASVVRLGAQFGSETSLLSIAVGVTDAAKDATAGRVWLLNGASGVHLIDAAGDQVSTFSVGLNGAAIGYDDTHPSPVAILAQNGAAFTVHRFDAAGAAGPVVSLDDSTRALGTVTGMTVLGGEFYLVNAVGELHRFAADGTGQTWTSISAVAAAPTGVSVAANGTDLIVIENATGTAHPITTAGVATGTSFSLRDFGAFNAVAIAFDGTNYRVVDTTVDYLFSMAPGGLPVTTLDVSAFSTRPTGLSPAHLTGDRFALIDADTNVHHVVNGATGVTEAVFSTASYGALAPEGLAFAPGSPDRYLVADDGQDLILVTNTTGLVPQVFSTAPHAPNPTDLAVDASGGGLVVLDANAGMAQVFTLDGVHLPGLSFSVRDFGSFGAQAIVWDGTNYRVSDNLEDTIFEMANGGLSVTSWDSTGIMMSPQDIAVHDDGRVALVDNTTVGMVIATPPAGGGTLTADSTISLQEFSAYQALGVYFDGTNYQVTDHELDNLVQVPPGGLTVTEFNVGTSGADNPTNLAIGPGGEFAVSSLTDLYRFSSAGAFIGTTSLRAFGINSAQGLTYDGTNYRVVDNVEDRLFEVAPTGLPVTTFTPGTFTQPSDVAYHPTRGTIFVLDRTVDSMGEFNATTGAVIATHDLTPFDILDPVGMTVDADGNLRIGDRVSPGRIFTVPPTGPDLQTWDLTPLGLPTPNGLAFDPGTGNVWISTPSAMHEICVAPAELAVVNTLDLNDFPTVNDARDVGVDRTRNELQVLTSDETVHIFSLPSVVDPNAGKILLLVEGTPGELPSILQAAGHQVVQVSLAGGALAGALDNTFSQVWIVNSQGAGAGPNLSTADLDALQAWQAATARDGVVLDALGWRTHATCATRHYTANLARTLEAAGGGVMLSTGAEQNPTANPADGGGQVVASVNQVLDRLNMNRFAGSYTTPATSLLGGGDFIDLAGAGQALPSFLGGSLTHAAVPVGAQPGGQTLTSSLQGTYTSQTGSQAFPNNDVQLLASTFGANTPDLTASAVTATAESILTVVPLSTSAVQDSTAVYVLSLTNVNAAAADFNLTPVGLPAGFTTTLDTANGFKVAPGATRYVLLSVDVPAAAAAQENAFTVRADEVLPTAEVRDRGSIGASLHVFGALVPLTASISPASTTEAAGVPVGYTLNVTNPQSSTATFAVDVLGTGALGAAGVTIPDFPLTGGTLNVSNFSVTGNADPGDYFLTVRVRSTDDPQILPRILLAKLTLGPRNDAPIASAGPDRTVAAPGGTPVPVTLDGTGSFDPEGQPLSYTWTGPGGPLSGATPSVTLSPGVYTYSLVVNDGALDSAVDAVTITVGDTTPPVVADQTHRVEQTSAAGTPVDFQALVIASDDTGAGWTVTPANGTYNLGTHPVLVTVTDASGNSASATVTIVVEDTANPTVTPPADIVQQTLDPTGDVVNFAATATDVCDSSLTITYSPLNPGDKFPIGTTVVTATATDDSGNVGTATFNVTVTLQSDTIKPTLQITTPVEGQIITNFGNVAVTMTYSDNAGGSGIDPATLVVLQDGTDVSSLFTDDNTATGASESLPFTTEGTHQVRARISDQAGNVSDEVVRTFVIDVNPPTFTPGSLPNLSAEQTSLAGAVATWTPPTASDTVDASVTITSTHNPGDTFPLGVTTVTYTATDDAGHTATLSFTVTVVDSTPPAAGPSPGDVTLEATSAAGATHSWAPVTFTDICDTAVDVVRSHTSGSTFPLGATLVTITGTDDTGNATAVTFTVTVQDTTSPTLTPNDLPDVTLEQAALAGTAYTWTPPTASDLVDGAVTPTASHAPGSLFNLGATVVTYTATDAAGNSASFTFTVTVEDTTPPAVTGVPADQTLEATSAAGAVATWAEPSFSDLCDASVDVVRSHNSGDVFPIGTTTVTYTGTDDSGLQQVASFTIVVADTTPPGIAPMADITVEQTALAGTPVSWVAPVTSDAVTASPTVTLSHASGSTFPLGTTTVTVTSTDDAGNSASITFDVTVQDTTPPSVAGVANLVAEATGSTGATVSFGNPGVTDNCDAAPMVVCSPASGSIFPIGTTTVTCTATDAEGNSSNTTFLVTVQDTTPPVISNVPAPITVGQATAAGTVVSWPDLTATDIVDGAGLTVVCSPASGTTFQLGVHVVTATATDAAGNIATTTFTVTVEDVEVPTLSGVPGATTGAAVDASGGPATWTPPTAGDVCDASPTLTSTHNPGDTFPLGQTTVTYTATDASGNSASASFTVTITDQTPPVITTAPVPDTEQTSAAGAVVNYALPTAADNVDGNVVVVCSPAPGSTFPLGATTVTCTATDAAGNVGTASFTVTVVDTTAPQITAPDMQVEATSSLGAVVNSFAASATDICDASVDLSFSGVPAGNQFPLGPTPLTVTATDDSGNSTTATFTVNVVDTIPPAIQGPLPLPNITVEQGNNAGTVVNFSLPAAVDLVDANPSVTASPASGTVFPLGDTTVTVTATDFSGNSSTEIFVVTVRDTLPPVLSAPADVTAEATSPSGAAVTFPAPVATDQCDSSPAVTTSPASGATFAMGTTVVTCTATDFSGNTATATFNVIVVDTTAPTMTMPPNVTVEQTTAAGTPVTFTMPTVSDAADPNPSITLSHANGSVFPLGTTTVTCTATDASNNAATGTFTITVVDTTPPTLSQPANITVPADDPNGATVTFADPTATDICDATPVVVCAPSSGSQFPVGTTTVTCTATDASGNAAQVTFTVTVEPFQNGDTIPPVITATDLTVEQATQAGTQVDAYQVTVTDDTDPNPTVTFAPPVGTVFPLGIHTVTVTATDQSGNEATATFTVTVEDTTAPAITAPADVAVEGSAPTVVHFDDPVVTDICDALPTVECDPASGSSFPVGRTVVTCTATDASGNVATATFTVTVGDTTPPTFNLKFCKRRDYAVGKKPSALDAGDLNGDGKLDVVTADFSSNTITVRLGNGDGTLGAKRTVKAGHCPSGIRLGDLNGDGHLDAVVTNAGGKSVSVFFGRGDGTFKKRKDTRVGKGPRGVALADLDGDGDLDVAVNNASDRTVTLLLNRGDGKLKVSSTSTVGAARPNAVTAALFGDDASVDVATANGPVKVRSAWRASAAASTHSPHPGGHAFWLPDLPGGPKYVFEGAADLIEHEDGSATLTGVIVSAVDANKAWEVSVFLKRFKPKKGAKKELHDQHYAPQGPVDPDLWRYYKLSSKSRLIGLRAFAGKTLKLHHRPKNKHYGFQVGRGANGKNLNQGASGWLGYRGSYKADRGDINVDLAAIAGGPSVSSWPGDGAGDLGARSDVEFGKDQRALVAADLDGDGDNDLAVADFGANVVRVLTNDGQGNFSLGASVRVGFCPTGVTAGDFDGDGVTDLAASNAGSNDVSVLRGDGSGGFSVDDTPGVGRHPSAIVNGDFNGDGLLDLATSNAKDNSVTILLNCGLPDITVEQANADGTVVTFATPKATDNTDPNPTVTCSPASGTTFPLGETTVTCTATDASGNSASVTFKVKVVDTTPPAITAPATQVVEANTSGGAIVAHPAVSVSDVCDSAPTVEFDPPAGSLLPLGTTVVNVTATDASGNSSTATFRIRVQDTVAPALSVPSSVTLEQAGPAGTPYDYPTSALDVADPSPTITSSHPSGTVFPLGRTTVTCTATDASGNTTSATFDVTVVDTRAPVISGLADITVEGNCPSGAAVPYPEPTVRDLCDAKPEVVFDPAPGTPLTLGTHTIKVVATDDSGNSSAGSFKITVEDTTAPVIDCPADLKVSVPPGSGAVPATDSRIAAWLAAASAGDACDTNPKLYDDAPSAFPVGDTLVTFTAMDASGNTSSCQAVIHVAHEALEVEVTAPASGLITQDKVTVQYRVNGAARVTVSGTRTLNGVSQPVDGTTFDAEGDYVIEVRAETSHGAVATDSVSFSIDRTAPTVQIASPVTTPHPGAYPASKYRYCGKGRLCKLLDWLKIRRHRCVCSDFPIKVDLRGSDDDGITGGVAGTSLTLDGKPLPAGTTELSTATFVDAGLPVLGRHVLEVAVEDEAGNVGTARVAFEIVLYDDRNRMARLYRRGGTFRAYLWLRSSPTGSALDPTYRDIVESTLRLRSKKTGHEARPLRVRTYRLLGLVVIDFPADRCGGRDKREFSLLGRFHSTTGPAFVAELKAR